ncbi:hypothetical protein AB434_0772 [Heyndrickxia coagulans]|uniref:Uncharacterized protein n=1 Tax=Heyndrickxia coagulans TaxID=1398 RepID=A0A0C5C713_HEYCO|nr:hypothetical protein SB48_HM08orf00601 [Heyndrickxia coagulans]AKN53177.1 hypothetical protein AB434_0772 [Heyndrickxia coagulans]KWZ80326.1 hypothetical protein HMPREF3213_02312 [Heyndrickxia coagulans]
MIIFLWNPFQTHAARKTAFCIVYRFFTVCCIIHNFHDKL